MSRLLPALAAALVLGGGARAEEAPSATGGLAWVSSDEIDVVGSMHVRAPVSSSGPVALTVEAESFTAIERSISGLTFGVRDVGTTVEAALGPRGARWSALAGVRGRARVDEEGGIAIRYVGAAWGGRQGRLAYRLAAAAVAGRRGVGADALAKGELRFGVPRRSLVVGFDLAADALVGPGGGTDLVAGPRLDLPVAGDRAVSLYARYLRGRNPLGIGVDAVLVGFELVEASTPGPRPSPPDLSGQIAAGAGAEGRRTGRLRLQATTPATRSGVRGVLDVDANAVTAEDTGELFYLYHLGVERSRGGSVTGLWYFHRSNHTVSAPNPIGVTSTDVLEAGMESEGWDGPPSARLDWRARAGVFIDSSFGPRGRAHVRGGIRVAAGAAEDRLRPWAAVEAEAGEVARRIVSCGVAFRGGIDLRIEARREEAFFGADPTVVGVVVTRWF